MKNSRLWQAAKRCLPWGVNSPVRSFRAVGGSPVFVRRARGAHFWDEDGRRFLDFCGSWGPLLFGHAPSGLLAAVRREIGRGTSFGACHAKEAELAGLIRDFFPAVEKVRLVSSGTEAVMSAIRLARGFTGRKKILKIDGGYHGHADSLLVKAGSGAATFGVPGSAGVPDELARLTLSLPFNDLAALERCFKKEGRHIAAFILEPIPANMGVVLPAPGYLRSVREITKRFGTLLIFDEVITGFRVSRGGAQELYGIRPDLTCLGKILGGGFPLAAFGGRAGVMDFLAPGGPVYQAGTLSGNPVAVAAALWMLGNLKSGLVLKELNLKSETFFGALRGMLRKSGLDIRLNAAASMFTLFFAPAAVTDYRSAGKSDTKLFAKFFRACLRRGLYLAPSQFEANFVSTAHSRSDLARALDIFGAALKNL